jgi:GntR family transcriptional repressor for pyruvate dehydrogenase complex
MAANGSGERHTDQMALTDEAIVKIKDMITSGELGPGDRLPKEADLAARLGLSRNSLREAVKALTLVNVLDVRHGDGTYVTSLDSAHLLDALSFMVDLHQDDSVLQFFEVRRLLEPGVAALAAVRITREQLADLRLLTSDLTADAPVDELVANDLRFHRGVAEASGNAVVCSLLDGISGATQRARIWRGVTQSGAVERTLAEHAAILDAIEIGDSDAARAWMTAHIAGVETWLRKAR